MRCVPSGIEKASVDPMAQWTSMALEAGGLQTYRLLKFIVAYFRLDSTLLAEGSVLVPYCEIWE
jgi:hypothetical protein